MGFNVGFEGRYSDYIVTRGGGGVVLLFLGTGKGILVTDFVAKWPSSTRCF